MIANHPLPESNNLDGLYFVAFFAVSVLVIAVIAHLIRSK